MAGGQSWPGFEGKSLPPVWFLWNPPEGVVAEDIARHWSGRWNPLSWSAINRTIVQTRRALDHAVRRGGEAVKQYATKAVQGMSTGNFSQRKVLPTLWGHETTRARGRGKTRGNGKRCSEILGWLCSILLRVGRLVNLGCNAYCFSASRDFRNHRHDSLPCGTTKAWEKRLGNSKLNLGDGLS